LLYHLDKVCASETRPHVGRSEQVQVRVAGAARFVSTPGWVAGGTSGVGLTIKPVTARVVVMVIALVLYLTASP